MILLIYRFVTVVTIILLWNDMFVISGFDKCLVRRKKCVMRKKCVLVKMDVKMRT